MDAGLRIHAWRLYLSQFQHIPLNAKLSHGNRAHCSPPGCLYTQFCYQNKTYAFCKISGRIHDCGGDISSCPFAVHGPRAEYWVCAATGNVLEAVYLDAKWSDTHQQQPVEAEPNLSTAIAPSRGNLTVSRLQSAHTRGRVPRKVEMASEAENYNTARKLIAKIFDAGYDYYYSSRKIKMPSQAQIIRKLQQYIDSLAARGCKVVNLTACSCVVTRAVWDENKRNPRVYESASSVREFDPIEDDHMIHQLATIAAKTFSTVQQYHTKKVSTKQIKYTIGPHTIAVAIQCQQGLPPKLPRVAGLDGRLPPQDVMLAVLQKYTDAPNIKTPRYITRTTKVLTTSLGIN